MAALITHINIISFDRKSLGGQDGEICIKRHSHMEENAFQIYH